MSHSNITHPALRYAMAKEIAETRAAYQQMNTTMPPEIRFHIESGIWAVQKLILAGKIEILIKGDLHETE